ncbi:MAG: glycerate kinase [Clostridiaceae bacterium]|nr:glycerate kinase [Clostridiaceae bacterium]
MKKFVLIPDSFKGTMTSVEICRIMDEEIRKIYPDADIVSIPVADGGEGSVDAFLSACGGKKIELTVKGPYLEEMTGFYGVLDNGTAVIEMAACAGLPLVENNKNPLKTSTYGVGQLILHAAESGCKKIIVGLGGSCTNDAGTGAAAACGVRFYNEEGKEFIPTGGTLSEIRKIDVSGFAPELKDVEIITMCDIDNPLYGPFGAAHVFGPQKGADEKMVLILDEGLRDISELIKTQLGKDISVIPGSGAAGGMGGGMVAFFDSKLQMGIETVLDTVNFNDVAKDADMIFTGEGKIDTQSIRGKVVIGVARRAKSLGVPVVAVVGDIGDDIELAYEEGVSGIFSINRVAVDFKLAKKRSKSDLALTMNNLMRFIKRLNF